MLRLNKAKSSFHPGPMDEIDIGTETRAREKGLTIGIYIQRTRFRKSLANNEERAGSSTIMHSWPSEIQPLEFRIIQSRHFTNTLQPICRTVYP